MSRARHAVADVASLELEPDVIDSPRPVEPATSSEAAPGSAPSSGVWGSAWSAALLDGLRGRPLRAWAQAHPALVRAYERGQRRRRIAAAVGVWRPRAGLPIPDAATRRAIRRGLALLSTAQEAAEASRAR